MEIQKYRISRVVDDTYLMSGSWDNPELIFNMCKELGLADDIEERMHVISFDAGMNAVAVSEVAHGGTNGIFVDFSNIFRRALVCGANRIVLVHNHPSGGLNASQEDIELTEKVIRTGRELNIELLDHIIVTNDDYMSMAEYEIGGF